MADDQYLIDQILPANSIHLICGPSGAGKTTFALQLMDDWWHSRPVLDYASHPAPVFYMSCNQSNALLERHMRKLRINPATFPHGSLFGTHGQERSFSRAFTIAKNRVEDLSLLFLDGLPSLCQQDITKDAIATEWFAGMIATCVEMHVTVAGIIRSAKERGGQGYASPRDRILGSGVISEMADTKICIEPEHPTYPSDPDRRIHILARGPKPLTRYYSFTESGLLLPKGLSSLQSPLEEWLKTLQPDQIFPTADLLGVAEQNAISRSSALRWRDDLLAMGIFLPAGYGKYRKYTNQ